MSIYETLKEAQWEQSQIMLSSSFLLESRLFERVGRIISIKYRLSRGMTSDGLIMLYEL
jgi:hypothetical protein